MRDHPHTSERPIDSAPATGGRPAGGGSLLEQLVEQLSRRLADLLSRTLADDDPLLADGGSFLRSRANPGTSSPRTPQTEAIAVARVHPPDDPRQPETEPLERLRSALQLNDIELQLLVLSGLSERHEGYAQIFRSLHPDGRPRPTLALAARLLGDEPDQRIGLRRMLESGTLYRTGLVTALGSEPFFLRELVPAEAIWPVLEGIDAWPERLLGQRLPVELPGLDRWLRGSGAAAVTAIRRDMDCTIVVGDEDVRRAVHRGLALVAFSGRNGMAFELPAGAGRDAVMLLQLHCVARDIVPVVWCRPADGGGTAALPDLSGWPGATLACVRPGTVELPSRRPLLGVVCERLRPVELAEMWRRMLPELAGQAAELAARFPLEPFEAAELARDLRAMCGSVDRLAIEDVAVALRTRAGQLFAGSVTLVRPAATWNQLVLPAGRLAQLFEAVARIRHQVRVFDEWRFLEGRRGARGVRMLFSGPPGTGKSLSAEVVAHALGVDLLQVDLSRVVSKWIGETEKNLAEAFAAAERSRAVLLFDEADALFGKRTEVSDAHDRYANLETAYLLTRLEQFEGLAILSTNLRQNMDVAFTRRMEFVVDFESPDRDQRLALWKCHLPDTDLLADDVHLPELAAHFPLVGGLIRNAAVSAAFAAAEEHASHGEEHAGHGTKVGRQPGHPPRERPRIRRAHFIQAIRREYDKGGRPFPGFPGGIEPA